MSLWANRLSQRGAKPRESSDAEAGEKKHRPVRRLPVAPPDPSATLPSTTHPPTRPMVRVIWGGAPLLQAFLTIVEVILVCSFGALLAHVVSGGCGWEGPPVLVTTSGKSERDGGCWAERPAWEAYEGSSHLPSPVPRLSTTIPSHQPCWVVVTLRWVAGCEHRKNEVAQRANHRPARTRQCARGRVRGERRAANTRPPSPTHTGHHHPTRASVAVQDWVLPAAARDHVCQGECGVGGGLERVGRRLPKEKEG